MGGITLIPLSTLGKMDWKASSFIGKWFCLPLHLFECCLFRRNILQLPLQSITIDYKREKTRLSTEMTESTDQAVRITNVQVCTGYKWKAHDIDQAVTRPSSGPQCFSKSMDNERYKIYKNMARHCLHKLQNGRPVENSRQIPARFSFWLGSHRIHSLAL